VELLCFEVKGAAIEASPGLKVGSFPANTWELLLQKGF